MLCNPMDCSPPWSSFHEFFQIIEWDAISYSRRSSWPRDQTHISCIGRQILYHHTTWEAQKVDRGVQITYWKILNQLYQLLARMWNKCPTLCDPISSVDGILQTGIPERVALPSSRGSSQPRGWLQSGINNSFGGGGNVISRSQWWFCECKRLLKLID